jgi:hypothetical protein
VVVYRDDLVNVPGDVDRHVNMGTWSHNSCPRRPIESNAVRSQNLIMVESDLELSGLAFEVCF